MSRELSDQVALANDGLDIPEMPEWEYPPIKKFDPRRQVTGLALRLLKSSNATTFRDPPYWNLS